jgi:hypothetical protein
VALAALAVLAALIGTVVSGAPAGASGRPSGPSVDGLAGPLSIDVTHRGDVLVGQAFVGLVSSVSRKGKVTDLVNEPGVSAVGEGPFGTVIYTVATEEGESLLKMRTPKGAIRVIADLGAYEARRNPDAHQTYGALDISDECADQWPVEEAGPPVYTGIVGSGAHSGGVGIGPAVRGLRRVRFGQTHDSEALICWVGRSWPAHPLPSSRGSDQILRARKLE